MVSKQQQYAAKAGFINLLAEGDTPSKVATKANIDSWIKLLKQPFTISGDYVDNPFAIKKTLGPKETAFIVDPTTGEILFRGVNITAALKELDKLP